MKTSHQLAAELIDGSAVYNWEISIVPESDDDSMTLCSRFIGTRAEAEKRGDEMAEDSGYDVSFVELARKGLVSPNIATQPTAPHAQPKGETP